MEGGFEPQDFRIDNVWERFARVGDLFAGVRDEAMDLTDAFDALGVQPDEEPPLPDTDAPLPRTAAPSTHAKTSEEIAAASKDPDAVRVRAAPRLLRGGDDRARPRRGDR